MTCWDCVYGTCLAEGLSGNNTLKFNFLSQIIPPEFLKMFSWISRISSVTFAFSSVAFLFVNNTWFTISISNYLGAWNIYFYPDDLLVSLFLFISTCVHLKSLYIGRKTYSWANYDVNNHYWVEQTHDPDSHRKKGKYLPYLLISSHLLIASDSIIIPFQWR